MYPEDFNTLLGNPVFGLSWEGFAIENILTTHTSWEAFFYRTSSGNEIDLILKKGNRLVAVEFKATTAPTVNKGFYIALEELQITEAYIVAIVKDSYPISPEITVCSLESFIAQIP